MRELKQYKEELVALGIVVLLLLFVRWLGVHVLVDPGVLDAAGNVLPGKESQLPNQYDLRSEAETIVWNVVRMILYALLAWLGIRITMPDAYKWFKRKFLFDTGDGRWQASFVLKLFAIFFFGLIGLHMSGQSTVRECVLTSAGKDIGLREATGNNDGPRIAQFQRHVGAPLKSSYCVAYVSFHLSACGVSNPKSAWSPAYAAIKDRVWTPRKAVRDPLPADVFTLYSSSMGRVCHGGFVKGRDGARYILTREANTNGGGSRNGDGVYDRRRELSKVYAITNYIHDETTSRPASRTTGVAYRTRLQGQTQPGERYIGARQHGDHGGGTRYGRTHSALRGERGATVARTWAEQQDRHAQLRPRTGDRSGTGRRSGGYVRVRYGRVRSEAARKDHTQHPARKGSGQVRGGPVPDTLVACGHGHGRSNDHHTADHQVGA